MRLRLLLVLLAVCIPAAQANELPPPRPVTQVCPGSGVQARGAEFEPGGIILTSFDNSAIWVYNVDRSTRYPLPETLPCGSNCRLAPDARWITYSDLRTAAISKMRLDGTERTTLANYASDVQWWSPDTLLIWTPGHSAYLQPEGGQTRDYLNVLSIVSVQPGGRWGLEMTQDGDGFTRALVNLETRGLQGIAEQRIPLGPDIPFFNATAWSPDGALLAYVAPGAFDSETGAAGAEIFAVEPGGTPAQLTDLNAAYGAVRINGRSDAEMSWSPDSRRIAFWVIELTGPDPEANTGSAVIHVLDIVTGEVRAYCDFATTDHTPDPPRLLWSPDSTHLAFGVNVPADDKGYLLLALNTETGVFTELSDGIFPALGSANPIAWGLLPGG
jgi:hypothetical protein